MDNPPLLHPAWAYGPVVRVTPSERYPAPPLRGEDEEPWEPGMAPS